MNKGKVVGLIEYIVAICIVVNCNTVWDRIGLEKINNLVLFGSLLILSMVAINTLMKNKTIFLKISMLTLFVMIYNMMFIFFNGENQKTFIFRFIFILGTLMIYSIYSLSINGYNKILVKISEIIVVLSIISLIFYLFATCLGVIKPNSTVTLKWGTIRDIPSYWGLYYNTQWVNFNGIPIIRNTGVFTEAPMYSFALSISLAIELFVIKDKRVKNILILCITALTTFSTTGIVTNLMMICIYIIATKSISTVFMILKISILPIVITISLLVGSLFIIDKIESSSNNKYGSFNIRMDDFKVGYEAWRENKLIGHGYDRHDKTKTYMGLLRVNDNGGSSGLMMILPQGGVYLLSIYLIPLIISLYHGFKIKDIKIVIIGLIITLLFTFTQIQYRYIIMYFLAIGWSFIIVDRKNIKIMRKEVIK